MAVARMPAERLAVRKPTASARLLLMEWDPHRSRPVLGDWQKVSSHRPLGKHLDWAHVSVSPRVTGGSCASEAPVIRSGGKSPQKWASAAGSHPRSSPDTPS